MCAGVHGSVHVSVPVCTLCVHTYVLVCTALCARVFRRAQTCVYVCWFAQLCVHVCWCAHGCAGVHKVFVHTRVVCTALCTCVCCCAWHCAHVCLGVHGSVHVSTDAHGTVHMCVLVCVDVHRLCMCKWTCVHSSVCMWARLGVHRLCRCEWVSACGYVCMGAHVCWCVKALRVQAGVTHVGMCALVDCMYEHVCVHSSTCTWACMCWCAQVLCVQVCCCVCRASHAGVHMCIGVRRLYACIPEHSSMHGSMRVLVCTGSCVGVHRLCVCKQISCMWAGVCCCAQVLRAQVCLCRALHADVHRCGCAQPLRAHVHRFCVCKYTSTLAQLCVHGGACVCVCVCRLTGTGVHAGSVQVSRYLHACAAACTGSACVSPWAHAGWARSGTWLRIRDSAHPTAVPPGETQSSVCVSVCVCVRTCVCVCDRARACASLLSSTGWSKPGAVCTHGSRGRTRRPGMGRVSVSSPVPNPPVSCRSHGAAGGGATGIVIIPTMPSRPPRLRLRPHPSQLAVAGAGRRGQGCLPIPGAPSRRWREPSKGDRDGSDPPAIAPGWCRAAARHTLTSAKGRPSVRTPWHQRRHTRVCTP